jgi:membrane-bound lytic murein transglycosylase B
MGRIRSAIAAAVVGAAIAAQGAAADGTTEQAPPGIGASPLPSSGQTAPGSPSAGLQPVGPKKPGDGNQKPPKPPKRERPPKGSSEKGEKGGGTKLPQDPAAQLPPLTLGGGSCGTGIPPSLIGIYQEASDRYGLGPEGPSILAAINEIESGFGANMGPSSAGAIGWMQFMPSTWDSYGVDADGDGQANPWDAEDAIFAAARYLRAGGMPEDPEGAIYAYNHADWYVADVLSRAACFSGLGGGAIGGVTLLPERRQLSCEPAKDANIPEAYLEAFQNASARYQLGESGVWAMAAVASLESDFGRGMSEVELAERGPLGIGESNWTKYAVDGDGDGRIARQSPADSAATLGRMVWASGDLRAGIFLHNHAAWYVDEVLDEAGKETGKCRVHAVAYSIALPGPTNAAINWDNLQLSNALEVWDLQRGAIDPRVMALIAAITQKHEILLSALRSDHSMYTSSGNVSNHYFGRAMDIAAVDGTPCTVTTVDGPCGRLARALADLPVGEAPTELIYCFDPDGPGPAWAQSDHCDHVHAGFDG